MLRAYAKDVGEADRAQLKEKESFVALKLQFLGYYNNTALGLTATSKPPCFLVGSLV